MKTWDEFVAEGVPEVVNDYGERRKTSKTSIIFPNGWVASIVEMTDYSAKYSVAVCDYNGYFDWDALRSFGTEEGTVLCNSEEEVASAIFIVSQLKNIA